MARLGRAQPNVVRIRRTPYNPTQVVVVFGGGNYDSGTYDSGTYDGGILSGAVAPAPPSLIHVQRVVVSVVPNGGVAPAPPTVVAKSAINVIGPTTGSVNAPVLVSKVVVTASSIPNGGVAPGTCIVKQPTALTQQLFAASSPSGAVSPGNATLFQAGVTLVLTPARIPPGGVAPLAPTVLGGGFQQAFEMGVSDQTADSLEGGISGGQGTVRFLVPSSIPNGGVAPAPPSLSFTRQVINVASVPVAGSVPRPVIVSRVAVTATTFPVSGFVPSPAITTSTAVSRAGSSFNSTGNIAAAVLPIVLPPNLVVNDLILLFAVNASTSGQSWSTPPGFIPIGPSVVSGAEVQQLFYKRAVDSSDSGATVNLILSSAQSQSAAVVVYRSTEPTHTFVPSVPSSSATAVVAAASAGSQTNTGPLNPGITNAMIVGFAGTVGLSAAGGVVTTITGGTQVGAIATTGNGNNASLAVNELFSSVPSVNVWTFSQNTNYSGGALLIGLESVRISTTVIVPASIPNGGVAPANPTLVAISGPFITSTSAQIQGDSSSPSVTFGSIVTFTAAQVQGNTGSDAAITVVSVSSSITPTPAQVFSQAVAQGALSVSITVIAAQVSGEAGIPNVFGIVTSPPANIQTQFLSSSVVLTPATAIETVLAQIQSQITASTVYSQAVFDPAGVSKQEVIYQVDVVQEEGMHDICVVSVRGADATAPHLNTGTPIHVRYGWGPARVEDFYGYVNHVGVPYQREVYGQAAYYMDVVCVGVSYVFKDGFSKIFTGTKASTIVESLATSNYFSSLVETDDDIWDQIACPGISGWEFLRELAARLGWLLMCNKSQLRFMSYDRALARNSSVMPTFKTKSAANLAVQETISSFEALQGETVPLEGHQRALRVLSGVDLRTQEPYTVQNDGLGLNVIGSTVTTPLFKAMQTDVVSNDSIFAQQRVDAVTQTNRFHIQATAMVSGDPSVTQGIPVVLLGIDSTNDGVWYVQKAHHKLYYNSYTTELSLGRDSTGDGGFRSTQSPAVQWSLTDSFANNSSAPPGTILVNGRWRATSDTTQELVNT